MPRSRRKRARRRNEKDLWQRWHAQRRARQRYGLQLTTADLDEMAYCIQCRELNTRFVKRQNNRLSHYLVEHEGTWYPVVLDRQRWTIVTFLPRSVQQEYKKVVHRD